jgi:hypothetical protein
MKWIYNISESTKNYHNTDIEADSFYQIPENVLQEYQMSVQLISDLALGIVKMSADGSTAYPGNGSDHVNFLKGSNKQIVQTQFEREDLTLKVACAKATVDENSVATIEFLIPGVMASGEGRYISGGYCFFDVNTPGDLVYEIAVVDKDNVLGYGDNTVLRTYYDDEADSENQGWYITTTRPLEIETLGFYGFIPSELYLVIKAKKANNITTGTFYVNIEYGKKDA